MAIDNFVLIVGNVVADPELRFTPSGKAVMTLRVAHNTRRRGEDGKWEDGEPSFFNVVAWDQIAENVASTVGRGDRVTVTGRIRIRRWETKEKEVRYATEIVADEVAPSLRWATATLAKTKAKDSGGAYEPPPYDPDEDPF